MGNSRRRLTDDENRELEALNSAVQAAIDTRREWIDAKMHEVAALQVGDDIFDVRKGRKLGVVSELYRSHAGTVFDTSIEVNYTYETSPRCFDNTSRQIGVEFGTREDAARHAKWRAELLAN